MDNNEMTLQTRVSMFLGCVLIFLPFSIGGPWLAISEICEYLNYPESIVFSSLSIFSICTPIALGPMVYLSFYSVLMGRKAPIQHQKNSILLMTFGVVLGVVFTIVFHVYYINSLNSVGYEKCNGIPSGYVPGMGVQYVKDSIYCGK